MHSLVPSPTPSNEKLGVGLGTRLHYAYRSLICIIQGGELVLIVSFLLYRSLLAPPTLQDFIFLVPCMCRACAVHVPCMCNEITTCVLGIHEYVMNTLVWLIPAASHSTLQNSVM